MAGTGGKPYAVPQKFVDDKRFLNHRYNVQDKQIQLQKYADTTASEVGQLFKNTSVQLRDSIVKAFEKNAEDGLWTVATMKKYQRDIALFEEMNATLKAMGIQETKAVTKAMKTIITESAMWDFYEMEAGLNRGKPSKLHIKANLAMLNHDAVEKMVNQNWSGKTFSSRVWDKTGQIAMLQAVCKDQLSQSMILGESVGKATKRIKDLMEKEAWKAQRVARTEIISASARSSMQCYQDNAHILDGVEWVATLDSRTDSDCAKNDGKVFPVDNVPALPHHPNCRCCLSPVVQGFKQHKQRLQRENGGDWTKGDKNEVIPYVKYEDWVHNRFKDIKLTPVVPIALIPSVVTSQIAQAPVASYYDHFDDSDKIDFIQLMNHPNFETIYGAKFKEVVEAYEADKDEEKMKMFINNMMQSSDKLKNSFLRKFEVKMCQKYDLTEIKFSGLNHIGDEGQFLCEVEHALHSLPKQFTKGNDFFKSLNLKLDGSNYGSWNPSSFEIILNPQALMNQYNNKKFNSHKVWETAIHEVGHSVHAMIQNTVDKSFVWDNFESHFWKVSESKTRGMTAEQIKEEASTLLTGGYCLRNGGKYKSGWWSIEDKFGATTYAMSDKIEDFAETFSAYHMDKAGLKITREGFKHHNINATIEDMKARDNIEDELKADGLVDYKKVAPKRLEYMTKLVEELGKKLKGL